MNKALMATAAAGTLGAALLIPTAASGQEPFDCTKPITVKIDHHRYFLGDCDSGPGDRHELYIEFKKDGVTRLVKSQVEMPYNVPITTPYVGRSWIPTGVWHYVGSEGPIYD